MPSLLDSGRPEAAMRELSRTLALDPGNPVARAERIAAAAMLRGAPPPWSVEALRESVAEILLRGNPRAVVRVLSRPVIREIGDAGLERDLANAQAAVGEE